MHLLMLIIGIGWAIGARALWKLTAQDANLRWQHTLFAFLFSPLLLLTSGVAIVCMGPQGQMVRWWEGWGSYSLAIGFLGIAIGWGLKQWIAAQRSLHHIRHLPLQPIQDHAARLLVDQTPFVAQIGLWNPELVVSQGLLDRLDAEHLAVVLTHEQAHQHYRDTFWFFWLGWLQHLTQWLPNTEVLWQELLMLRELRADRWAAQRVDPLLLAEALLSVVSAPHALSIDPAVVPLNSAVIQNRLSERIEALLTETTASEDPAADPLPHLDWQTWGLLLLTLLPLTIVPFHF